MRICDFSIVSTRNYVVFFRNYGSQCDRSYGVTAPQFHRNEVHGSFFGGFRTMERLCRSNSLLFLSLFSPSHRFVRPLSFGHFRQNGFGLIWTDDRRWSRWHRLAFDLKGLQMLLVSIVLNTGENLLFLRGNQVLIPQKGLATSRWASSFTLFHVARRLSMELIEVRNVVNVGFAAGRKTLRISEESNRWHSSNDGNGWTLIFWGTGATTVWNRSHALSSSPYGARLVLPI